MGNRNIWFGAIFPYMAVAGNEGISLSTIITHMVIVVNESMSFSAIIYTIDVTFLLVLVPLPICY